MIASAASLPARVYRLSAAAAIGLLLGYGLFTSVTLVLTYPSLWDLQCFVDAGRALAAGTNPYLPSPNLNAPASLPLFHLFAYLDANNLRFGWYLISVALYAAALFALARTRPLTPLQLGWAIVLPGFWDSLILGQIYALLGLMVVGAWMSIERGRQVWAGLLIGLLVAVKPNFAVWPAILLLSGYAPQALFAGTSAAAFAFIPALMYGPEVYPQWLEASQIAVVMSTPVWYDCSLPAVLGSPGLGLAAMFLVAVSVWAARVRPAALTASSIALVASVLAAPVSWPGYTIFLTPALFRLNWSRSVQIAAVMMLIPAPYHAAPPDWYQSAFGFMHLGARLILIYEIAVQKAVSGDAMVGSGSFTN